MGYTTIANLKGPQGRRGERGLPGVNGVPADQATAAYVAAPDSHTSEAIYDRYYRFDLMRAHPHLVGKFGYDAPSNKVMQAIFTHGRLPGEIWYTFYQTNGEGNEDTWVVRCSPNGEFMEYMVLVNGGHGNGGFIEVTSGGQIFVWLLGIDYTVSAGSGNRYHYYRIPWANGSTLTVPMVMPYRVAQASAGKTGSIHYDEFNDVVAVRQNQGTTPERYRFVTYDREELLGGSATPLTDMTYENPGYYNQSWAYYDKTWYVLSGTPTSITPYFQAEIYRLNAVTGALAGIRNIEMLRRTGGSSALDDYSEPETLAVSVAPNGAPALLVGFTTGQTNTRENVVYAFDMTAPNLPMMIDTTRGLSPWATRNLSYNSGYSSDPDQPLLARRNGDYLEFIGRVLGPFEVNSAAAVPFMTMLRGFLPKRTMRTVVAAASPAGFARISLAAGGTLSYFIPGSSGTIDWVDLSGARFYIGSKGNGTTWGLGGD